MDCIYRFPIRHTATPSCPHKKVVKREVEPEGQLKSAGVALSCAVRPERVVIPPVGVSNVIFTVLGANGIDNYCALEGAEKLSRRLVELGQDRLVAFVLGYTVVGG